MKAGVLRVLLVAVLLAITGVTSAQAQAIRTWVSGLGDDVNPCSRTAPCKTFAGAISKTAANGTINCIDPGGFGAITIKKSITIDCAGTFGSILAAGTNGVNVDGAGVVVHLRNLSIEGSGSGIVGINFTNGAVLTVEKCAIFGFNAGQASGINFIPTADANLYVSHTAIGSNGSVATGTGAGVRIRPTGTANVRATFKNVDIIANATGFATRGDGGTGFIRVALIDSTVHGSANAGVTAAAQGGQAFTRIFMKDTLVTNSGTQGISADGSQSAVLLDQSTIFSNDVGLSIANGGQILGYTTSNVNGNINVDGPTTQTLPLK